MYNNLQILCLFFLLSAQCFTQSLKKETLTNQGSSHFVYANNKSFYIQESIGQTSVIRTFNAQNYSLRQGFLQPVHASFLNDNSDSNLDAVVFPNPFSQSITIIFNEPIFDELTVYVSDVMGRTVHSQIYHPTQNLTIQLSNVANGVYVLHVRMRQKIMITKIIKE
ncbi:T9SS type A sorting domain-containing protein [Psychroserpens mesophilus]|uniref:T9SS type A sorting domain-containing protein n=1 Tax=Psychroserpens mesophilus TaxID=325473 RepID=UPI001362D7E2|nr:T9SS type A sorting domain-containing protein [Psychroserpens mesophilus]